MSIHPSSRAFAPIAAIPSIASGPAAACPVALGITDRIDDLTRLGQDWNALFQRAGRGCQMFQTHGWIEHWARIYLPDLVAGGGQLAILTARQNGRLVMVWPLIVSAGRAGRVVELAGAPVSQYADVVVDAASDAQRMALMRTGWAFMCRELRPDVVVLGRVREDATIAPLVKELGGVAFGHLEAPWLQLAAGSGGVSFETGQKGSAKRNRRRLWRRLEQGGSVATAVRSGGPQAVGDGMAALGLKRAWLDRCGLTSRAFADTRIEQFFSAVLADPDTTAGTMVFSLSQGDRPVAFAIGVACQRRLALHVIVHDPAYDDCGAGLLNLEACLRHAEASGFETFDLLPPRASYKLQFATGSVGVADHAIGVTLRGRLVARLWHGMLRDRLKAWATRLPVALQRRLARAA